MDLYAYIRGTASAVFHRPPGFHPSNGTKPTMFSRRAKLIRKMKRRYIIKQRLLCRKAGARKFLTNLSAISAAVAFTPAIAPKNRVLNISSWRTEPAAKYSERAQLAFQITLRIILVRYSAFKTRLSCAVQLISRL